MWWVGASLLVAGSVIIGRREEDTNVASVESSGSETSSRTQQGYRDRFDVSPVETRASGSDGDREDSIELTRRHGKADGGNMKGHS